MSDQWDESQNMALLERMRVERELTTHYTVDAETFDLMRVALARGKSHAIEEAATAVVGAATRTRELDDPEKPHRRWIQVKA